MPEQKSKNHRRQEGGSASGYSHLWYASSPTNIQTLSKYTVNRLGDSPMFNPLKYGTKVPTPTNGLTPTGVHLGNGPSPTNYYLVAPPLYLVGGGETEANNSNWYKFVKPLRRQ